MTVLAAIDERARSERVVTIAHDLATAYDDTLLALHVVPREDYAAHREALKEIPGFGDFTLDREAESAKRFAREFVTQTLDDVGDVEVEARGRVGDVAEEILTEADRVEPRYLVISGRRRSPTGKAIFGNTTQKILLNADCPVVTELE